MAPPAAPRARPLLWVDVFTATPLAGNGLAVVHDADDLADDVMQRFAHETGLSETTFVQAPERAGADYRNRIFTVDRELPFAGHPSLGTAVAVAWSRGLAAARFVQETHTGLQPVEVTLDGRDAHTAMTQEPAVFAAPIDPAAPLAALGLDGAAAHPELPVQAVSTGVRQLLVPVADEAALTAAVPVPERVRAVLDSTEALCLYVFAPRAPGEAEARSFFGTGHRIAEDPATGSAAGPLCAYLARHQGTDALVVSQGVAMGRRSRLEARLHGDRVRVGGACVVIMEGSVWL